MQQDLITTKTVAHELGRCEATVRKMADDGRIPVVMTLTTGVRLFDRVAILEHKAAKSK